MDERSRRTGRTFVRHFSTHGDGHASRAKLDHKHSQLGRWAVELEKRKGYWKTVVTIMARNARMARALLETSLQRRDVADAPVSTGKPL